MDVFGIGLATGLTLILAIGAQNAFVLRQGLRGEHVLAVVLTCAISDALLIALGVTSFGHVAAILPWLETGMRFAGAAFLIWYGLRSLRSALQSTGALVVDEQKPSASLGATLLTCLALTWLNPHVYLDTVVLLGSISTQFPGAQMLFAAGAITGSFVFFFALGFGARLLRPAFANPASWRWLEGAIAVVMWLIVLKLLWPEAQD
ncbi:amino acid transporter [Devosia sp. WQ 349]|uniref:LysE/ArgO family amino acid transporter n=1 Tax=Devosia sp. WQ 349K1 TaxID=2800329 RepID=UPI0019081E4E|nr:LysE/ArgO family amino acid transporter [Devosia sp. WQ 349K1]MBK1793445.1 amino acid transporter [Devosia sp. WQ 349K1]